MWAAGDWLSRPGTGRFSFEVKAMVNNQLPTPTKNLCYPKVFKIWDCMAGEEVLLSPLSLIAPWRPSGVVSEFLNLLKQGTRPELSVFTSPQDAGRGGKASNKVYNQHTHTGDLG